MCQRGFFFPFHSCAAIAVQLGFPYQYRQAGTKPQQLLSTANTLLRLLLHKIAPVLFSPSIAMMMGLGKLGKEGWGATLYTDVWRKAQATTRNIWIGMAVLAAAATKAAHLW